MISPPRDMKFVNVEFKEDEHFFWPTIPKGSRTGLIVVLPYSCEFGVAAGKKGLG